MTFTPDATRVIVDRDEYGLALTQQGHESLWLPSGAKSSLFVAVAGRLAFDEDEWDAAEKDATDGGLAARAVERLVGSQGPGALAHLNGNAAVVVHDRAARRLYLVTDRCGVFPTFEIDTPAGRIYGSHADVLADAGGQAHRLDEVSLADFILSGTVTPPYTYYEAVRATEFGSVLTFDLTAGLPRLLSSRRYFDLAYAGDERMPEAALVEELAAALHRSVRRRSSPRVGPSAIALSGGLDSRVVLACRADRERTFAFTLYDEANRELRTAEAIAQSESTPFLPLRRAPDYYAEHAEQGVRLSGGMGSFANNHFLGVLPELKQRGMQGLLTGCYCDYLFKGLPLNRATQWFTGREVVAPFSNEFYFDHFDSTSTLAVRAAARRADRVPADLRTSRAPDVMFQVEARRTFPLNYEGDNQQRLVPQRMTGWCPPFVDRDVVDVYRRLPYHFKLNRSVFKKVAARLTPDMTVADANTGARPMASTAREWLGRGQLRAHRRWRRMTGAAAAEGSWPDWTRYAAESPGLDGLWHRPSPEAADLFQRVLGRSLPTDDVRAIRRRQPFLFIGLLTVKIWLEQRP